MKKRIENALFPVAFVMGSLGVLIASGVLLALVFAVAVKAQDGDRRDVRWATKRFCAHYSWDGSCSRYRYERRRVHVHQHYQPERVRFYAAPRQWDGDDDRDRQQQCREVRKAVGDQHLTVDGAKKQANEAWAAAVRFHHGEKFIDLANARHAVYTCSRSSIKEAGTTVTTLGQQFNRCELEAVPCSPVRQREEER